MSVLRDNIVALCDQVSFTMYIGICHKISQLTSILLVRPYDLLIPHMLVLVYIIFIRSYETYRMAVL